MTYSGRYIPVNRDKYKGNPLKIFYRSLWERRLMDYCDRNQKVVEWGSEEIAIPYLSPVDGKVHRYFPDFYVKLKEATGKIKRYIIEVKPKKQLKPPAKPKRQTKSYLYEAYEYARNQAKWKAASNFCKDRLYEFKVMTEDELGIK